MRVLISLCAFVLIALVGVKTEWLSLSKAALAASEDRLHAPRAYDDRAYEAVVLGQTQPNATSGELIDAAVVRGDIGSDRALLYGVYLACADPRLPEAFRGLDVTQPEKNILWEADVDWTQLSPDIQKALRAFFTEGPAGRHSSACAGDIARLKGDPSVWWAAALPDYVPASTTARSR
jgi:hypothetical protein